MATKDNSSGLLSKMARFVRNPTKDWSELDNPEPEPEGGYSKQSLKEMIERKRQNDFVRRREFDHLRKLRRNGPSIQADSAGRPSFFQSSIPSNLNERATTLKKIDEIEAQMSKQWWKGKQEDAPAQKTGLPAEGRKASVAEDHAGMVAAPGSGIDAFATTQPPESLLEDRVAQVTLPTAQGPMPAKARQSVMATGGRRNRGQDADVSEFSSSKLFSIEMGSNLADPDLEEAAIRFANGDDAGAEAGLLAALGADHVDLDSADGWAAALFDLYRSTGQQASFDRVAIDFAQRFGHSAPGWFSTPELLGAPAVARPPVVSASRRQTVWECPSVLDGSVVQALLVGRATASVPWNLNWQWLESITPDAAKALAELFEQWCTQPVSLHFEGGDVLDKVLRSLTPAGDKRVDSCWWTLRLNTLRILNLQDEFELAALEYCVTYEVSPPPWEDPRCQYVQAPTTPTLQRNQNVPVDFSQAPTEVMSFDTQPPEMAAAVVELTGEVLGDAADALNKFQVGLKGSDRLVVSCARLIRVDFSAAGSILNWVASREADGCEVQFRDVPRLVAAFFNVIGINEHARVILRTT